MADPTKPKTTVRLAIEAECHDIAPVMRYPGGDFSFGGISGKFTVPLGGGMCVVFDGKDGEWFIGAEQILRVLIAAIKEGS